MQRSLVGYIHGIAESEMTEYEHEHERSWKNSSVQSLSHVQLCNPMDCSTPGLPVHHQLPESTQSHIHWVVMPSNHLILYHPLFLSPLIFPSIRVFSNEPALRIKWPKYWSFSFSISPSKEYSGLISFRIDWFELKKIKPITGSTFSSPICHEVMDQMPWSELFECWVLRQLFLS